MCKARSVSTAVFFRWRPWTPGGREARIFPGAELLGVVVRDIPQEDGSFLLVGFHLNRPSEPWDPFGQYSSRPPFAIPFKKYFLLLFLSLLPHLCAVGECKRHEAREKLRGLEDWLFCGEATSAWPYLKVWNGEAASTGSLCPLIRESELWGGSFHLGIPVGVRCSHLHTCCRVAAVHGTCS